MDYCGSQCIKRKKWVWLCSSNGHLFLHPPPLLAPPPFSAPLLLPSFASFSLFCSSTQLYSSNPQIFYFPVFPESPSSSSPFFLLPYCFPPHSIVFRFRYCYRTQNGRHQNMKLSIVPSCESLQNLLDKYL